ncbi:hypothetical protein SAMN02799624_03530 [Paenibacillus sp. UNC496MF]|nr:hypothetical protein SAMN02799624_03530 [Paenibacillus sp. UNC496MF]
MNHPYWHEKQIAFKNRELREFDKHAWKWTQVPAKPKKRSSLFAILLLPLRAFGMAPQAEEPPSGEQRAARRPE